MNVYFVGDHGPEHNSIHSVHKIYEGALKAWNELRVSLLQDAQSFLEKDRTDKEM